MSKMHRVFPTLDMFIDVKADNEEDAISKVLNDKAHKIPNAQITTALIIVVLSLLHLVLV